MLKPFKHFFAPPSFNDEEKSRSAFYINIIVLSNIPILVLFIIVRTLTGAELFGVANIILLVIITVLTGVWFLMRNGWVRLAGYLHITTIWLASTMIALSGSGIRDTAFTSYFVVMLMAGLLLGWRPALGFTVLSILAVFGLAHAETTGTIDYVPGSTLSVAIEGTVLFLFGAIFLYLIITSLQKAIGKANINADELRTSNRELTVLRDVLELHVQERTSAMEKRSIQLQAVSQVARAIASVQDINELLPDIAKLISDQFGFYHAGIFLVEENVEFAALRAANSAGGQRMLYRQHKLKLDEKSIVGYTTSRGEPRIALDVGKDAVYFDNPDLPETRSEMALPLRVGGRVIGALDVQSTEPNAFAEEDVAILFTLADQVAIAIENARLFSESREALRKSEETFSQYILQEWSTFARRVKTTGYKFDGARTTPLIAKDKREKVKEIPNLGSTSLDKETHEFSIPIRFRGETIGVFDVKSKNGNRKWTVHDITLLEAAAERTALALENARLVESSQRRASRERTIGEISSKVGSLTNVDAIMQAAVEELGRRIGGATEVTLELNNENKYP